MFDTQCAFGGDLANMLSLMRITARICELKWILLTTLEGKSEDAVALEPLRYGDYHLSQITKINQAVACRDQLKMSLVPTEPASDFGNLELIVNIACPCKFYHLRRKVHAGHASCQR